MATILVVDDQPELLSGLQLTLEAAGYQVLVAEDGYGALEQLRSTAVDLILADIAMPELNGYQLYEQVRADPQLLRIPFVFLTARALASDVRYGKMLGVDDYLTKPVKPEDLLAAVEGRLRRARDLALLWSEEQASKEVAATPSAEALPQPGADALEVGPLRIATAQHRVWLTGREVELSAREFRVLELLARHPGEVIAPTAIVQVSHGIATDEAEASALLRPMIRTLRRRLGYAVGEMGCIENVRSVGYRLVIPED
ncbi:response regulator transcription factor [Candidatus Viridilinea mediisalina]|uniref:response regulator transcription factor n=1 Tax=Candidatus Viridilinea mediisalina TaxID=2024553 RepID=UPI0013FE4A26|nr:response regulator transcription factor [Candidatus Viridilinea mediisalina]